MPLVTDIGPELVALRKAKGWSQAALASRVGVKRQQLQRWESIGYLTASLEATSRVAEVLGWTPTQLQSHALPTLVSEADSAYGTQSSAPAGAPPVKDLAEVITRVRSHAGELEQRFAVSSVTVFGSFARGEQAEGSDVDLLVELASPTVENMFGAEELLEDILGRRTESGSLSSLNPRVRESVLQEAVRVWPA